jgi:YbbR domain-containing protein
MLRKTLTKIFSSRVFYIVFSLLVAIALWMYVEISENQHISHEVSNVQVRFLNEDILKDRGLLRSSFDPQAVTLTFSVPRAVAARLTRDSLAVEVDLVDVTSTGFRSLPYEIIFPSDTNRNEISLASRSVERISLFIDRISVRPIPVRGEYRGGTASDDLIANPAEFEPTSITIQGPEDVISRISHARVPIFRENLSTTYIDDLGFVLLDDYGEELEEDQLDMVSVSHETIRVTVQIRQMKDVPLVIELIHGAGTSEQNTNWTVDPPFITVSGDPEALRDYNQVSLGSMDTTRFSLLGVDNFPIRVPDHISNDSGEQVAQVRVEVLGLQFIDLSTTNLFLINKHHDLEVEWVTQSLDVRIRGRREDLDLITDMSIMAVADLSDVIRPGPVRPSARVYVDGIPDVGAVGEYRFVLRMYSETS